MRRCTKSARQQLRWERYLIAMTDGNDDSSLLNANGNPVSEHRRPGAVQHVKIYCVGFGNDVNTNAFKHSLRRRRPILPRCHDDRSRHAIRRRSCGTLAASSCSVGNLATGEPALPALVPGDLRRFHGQFEHEYRLSDQHRRHIPNPTPSVTNINVTKSFRPCLTTRPLLR